MGFDPSQPFTVEDAPTSTRDEPSRDYFARNKAWMKPGSRNFYTDLSDDEEKKFQAWVKANKVPNDDSPQADYDMRGFWKALEAKDPKAISAIDPNDKQLHYPDYWKTPYHETFSGESKWADPAKAPKWNDRDQLVMPDGKVLFDDRAQNKPSAPSTFDPTKPFDVVTASEKDDLPWDVPYTGAQMRTAREQIRKGEEALVGSPHGILGIMQRGGQQLLGERPPPTPVEALEEASLGVRPSGFVSGARTAAGAARRIEPPPPGSGPTPTGPPDVGGMPVSQPSPWRAPTTPEPPASLSEAGLRPPQAETGTETVAVPQGDGTVTQVQVQTGQPPASPSPPAARPPVEMGGIPETVSQNPWTGSRSPEAPASLQDAGITPTPEAPADTPPPAEPQAGGPTNLTDIRAGFPDISDAQFETLFQQASREVPRPMTADPADQSAWMKSLMGVMARLAVPATQPQQQTSGDPWAPVAIAPVGRPDGETPIAQSPEIAGKMPPVSPEITAAPVNQPEVSTETTAPAGSTAQQTPAVEAHGGPWSPVLDDDGQPTKNHLGDTVYENPNGVRAILDNGVPYTEATKETDKGLVPKNPGDRKRQHLTVDEPWEAEKPKVESQGKPGGKAGETKTETPPKAESESLPPETSKKPVETGDWKRIGENEEGDPLFTNEQGVHSVVKDGVRIVETVRMRPTRGGMEMSVPPPAEKEPAFRPVKAEEPEVKPEPKPKPRSEPTPSDTGLGEIGDAGKAIGANLRDMLWDRVQAGKTESAGGKDNLLILAKPLKDAGGLKDRAEFDRFVTKVAPLLGDRSDGWQDRLKQAGQEFMPQPTSASPSTKEVAKPEAPKPRPAAKPRPGQVTNEILADFFTPGETVPGYGSSRDKVVAFHPPEGGRDWSVDVQEVMKDGSLGRLRNHRTTPAPRELEMVRRERAARPTAATPTEAPKAEEATPKKPPSRIKPASEDVSEVLSATFPYGRDLGTKMMPIDKLTGGVALNDPKQAKRVADLEEQILSDDGYISRLIVDSDGNVIEGQHRLEALRKIGARNVPVHVIHDLAKNIDTQGLEKAVGTAQKMHPDQRHQLIDNLLNAVYDEGSPAKVVEEYEAPTGYETAWNAALDFLMGKQTAPEPPATEPEQKPIPSSLDVAEQQVKDTNATLPGYDPKTGEMVDPDAVFADILANSIEDPNHVITASGLQAAAQGIYGGTLADGTLKRDRLYDAIELGVNTFISRHPERFAPTGDLASAQKAAAELAALKGRIPTQTVRAGDKVKLQQFSTPPDYAFAAVWAANIHPADVVIEPSAGTGGIAVHAMNAGARVIGNEISPQRRSMMATLPFGRITAENAEQLHNILPREIKPNVVVMNPPFSSAGDRMGGKMVIETGAVHIEQALKRLAPGGRLVAIVGDGMKPEGAETAGKGGRNNATGRAFRDWWKKIGAEYDVRANIGVGGEIYRKYGTTFPTRLLVIDKVAPSGQPPVVTTALTSAELLDALQGVRDARPGSASEPVADQSGGSGVAQQGQGVSGSSEAVRPPTGDVGPGGEQDRPPAADSSKPTGTRGGKAGSVRTGSGQRPGGSVRSDAPAVQQPGPDPQGVAGQSGEQPVTGDVSGGSGTGGDTSHLRPDGSDLAVTAPAPELLETSIVVPEEQTGGELTESVYENYRPQRISIEGAQPHPGPLVQSAAMASVLPPLVTYKTALPKKLITEGAVSDAQLEAIVYSGNAHAQMLEKDKDGIAKRRGFFIGDGCVAAGTRIYNPLTGEHTPIEQLVDKSHVVLALTTEGFRPTVATRTFHKGVAALYCVVLDDGRSITVTGQHRFLTPDGWAKIDDGVVQIGVALACSEARPCGDASLSPIHDACDRLGSRTLQDYPGGCSDPFCDGRLPRAAGNAPKLAPSPTDVLARNHPRLRTDAWAPSPSRSGPHQSADHHSRRNWPPSESLALALNANQVHATLVLSWPGIPQNDGQSLPVIVPPLQSAASIRPRQPAPAFGWSQSLTEGECHACEADRQSLAGSCRSERQVPSNGRQSSRLGSSPGSDLRGLIPVSSAWHIITSVEPIGSHDFYDMYVPGPENYVAEGFVNHNTGVGKGREVAGIILDNKWQGRKKALWVSEKMQLANDAKRDWAGLGQNPNEILVHGKIKAGDEIKHDGILFTTYPTVASGEKFAGAGEGLTPGAEVALKDGRGTARGTLISFDPKQNTWAVRTTNPATGREVEIAVPTKDIALAGSEPKTRVQQIVDWLGKDFDGVIAFDEAHNMANVTGGSGTRGKKEAAAKALAGLELQNALPNARVVYVSATGATEVSNLAYADRLGLWGPGTAFADRGDFLSRVASGGVAAMELVARDMKALGYYTARSLSYDGVEYDRVQHDLTPPQRVMYDKIADAWQLVLRNMMEALKDTGADGKGGPKSAILSAFWGGHQRFFNQLITSLQMPSVIEGIDKDLAEGRQAVLQLVNTNEAGQERALDKSKARGDEDLDELDMSPRDQLLQLVDKAYPTRQYEEYLDDEGNVRVRPVSDSEGNPVHNPEAIAAKEKLLTDLGSLRVPDGPLEILVNHYGPDAVAEVTGRKQRVVERPDEAGKVKKVLEKRGTDANVAEANSFQSGKKKILIFSQAGGTGRSYHDDKTADRVDDTDRLGIGGNGARRSHYLVQAGWRADTAVQGFGRTHRTNQWTAPIFHLVTTDLEGQKRFISSIARRLGQLGALTKGERRTGDQGMFGLQDNLESDEAKAGLVQLFRDIHGGKVEGFSTDDLAKQMGLVIENDDGSLKDELPPMTQFLNRVLSLKVDDQNRVFGEFATRFRDIVDRAAEAGTLDAGTETYKADKITKARDQVVYTDPNSRAETRHVHLVTSNRNYPTSFNDLMSGQSQRAGWNAPEFFVQNKRSGYISAVTPTTFTKVDPSGIVTEHYRVSTPLDWQYVPKDDLDDSLGLEGNLTRVTNLTEARTLWDDRVVKTPEFREADLHIITGAILPIWDRLSGQPKIFRLLTDDGERLLGRVVDNKVINQTLERLGAEGVKLDIKPADVVTKILDGGVANLANGWTIKRRRVAREYRLELTGTDLYSHTAELEAAGVFRERIPGTYDTRYFIPAGETGGATIEAITKRRPIISLEGD